MHRACGHRGEPGSNPFYQDLASEVRRQVGPTLLPDAQTQATVYVTIQVGVNRTYRKILTTRQHPWLPRVVVVHEDKLDWLPWLYQYLAPLLQLDLKLNVENVVSTVTAHLRQSCIRVVRRFTQVPHY